MAAIERGPLNRTPRVNTSALSTFRPVTAWITTSVAGRANQTGEVPRLVGDIEVSTAYRTTNVNNASTVSMMWTYVAGTNEIQETT